MFDGRPQALQAVQPPRFRQLGILFVSESGEALVQCLPDSTVINPMVDRRLQRLDRLTVTLCLNKGFRKAPAADKPVGRDRDCPRSTGDGLIELLRAGVLDRT